MNFLDINLWQLSVHHDGSGRYVRSQNSTALQIGDNVTLRLRIAQDAPLERLLLRLAPDGEQQFIEMQPEETADERNVCRWWAASLRLSMPVTHYRFLLFTSQGAWWYNGRGLRQSVPTDAEDFRLLAGLPAPQWVHSSVFYQIFPDRFADGDPSNNVRQGEYEYHGRQALARRWGEPPASGWDAMIEFYGGDLLGIEQRLDYLQDLGINALYLNPIFTAYSNHRYDVVDYENVDPHLGGNAALAALRRATAQREMRLMLDIVPNHCGLLHPWFQAACVDPNAPSAEFFTFHHHPEDYACWLGVRSLPKLNYRSMALREVMYAGSQSIFRRWLRPPYSIDGWRLDVANMLARQGADQLGLEVGRGIHQAVKQENPQAYLLGENFFDGSPQLQGDLWDATMNYSGFAMPVWYWLGGFSAYAHGLGEAIFSPVPWGTQALVDSWAAFRAAVPWQTARQQFNLLGSHDTTRILSGAGGDAARNRLAVGLLMTYVGVPSIYYGDEIGMAGEGSQVRACMNWEAETWDHDLRAFYQKLIHLRRTSPALIDGGFQVLLVGEDTLAYLRDADEEQLVVIGQRGPRNGALDALPVAQAAIPDGCEMVELFSGRRLMVEGGHLPVGAVPPGVQIWRCLSC